MDLVEICNVCARKAIIEAAKRIINSDKVCHSYSDFNFGVTFLEHSVYKQIKNKFTLYYICELVFYIRFSYSNLCYYSYHGLLQAVVSTVCSGSISGFPCRRLTYRLKRK